MQRPYVSINTGKILVPCKMMEAPAFLSSNDTIPGVVILFLLFQFLAEVNTVLVQAMK